jgi:outer membrane protein, heavy metal efflux system
MQKIVVFALCGCWLSISAIAQSTGIEDILHQVEQNNRELKSLSAHLESRRLELKSANNLPDPQFGAYYLPFGNHTTGDYSEFQITQSLEFPTVYGIRGDLIDRQSAQLELEFKTKRREILSEAKSHCLNLIYLNQLHRVESLRVEQARQVIEQVQELYAKEQVGILELNKARVAWMQDQNKVRQIENEMRNITLLLANLNGSNAVTLSVDEYAMPLELAAKDSIWQEKMDVDPEFAQLKQQEVIAQQALKLARNKVLPNLTAGFNHQGVAGAYYSGVYAGVSIPWWSNRYKVKAAQSQVEFQGSFTASITMKALAAFDKQYNDYQTLLGRYREYQNTLGGLNSDELLLKAYRLGEISFLEYYMELQFYRQAYDAMLDMQYRLYLMQTELLKHQL